MNFKTTIVLLVVLVLSARCTVKEKDNAVQNLESTPSPLSATKTKSDSLELAMLNTKGLLHFSENQMDSFYFYNRLLKKKGTINGSLPFVQEAQFNLGYYYDEVMHRPDSAFFYYQQAKNTSLKIGNIKKIHSAIMNIALLQKNMNDFYGAKETLTEALEYLSSESTYLSAIYNELATNNRKLQNYSEALKYYELALDHSKSPKKNIKYKNNLAILLTEMKDYGNAMLIFKDLLMDESLGKGSTYARILDNYTYAQWKSGKTGLQTPFFEALEIRKSKRDKRGQIASHTHLGEYFSNTAPETSKKYLDSAIQLSRLLKMPRAETDALQFLMDLEPQYIAFRNRYIFLKDSMYSNELQVKTQFAKMKYDDEQEKSQIRELETETAQKRAELAEQRTQKVMFLALSVILLIGGTSLYFVLRQRHKKDKLQEVYNTEKRISQDLHDGLANDVFGLMTSLQNKERDTASILNRLEGIYEATRKISHENAPIPTGAVFKEELQLLIGTYHVANTNILVKGMSTINWHQFDEHKCVVIHRTIKELLVNMTKHARASLVSLQFKNQKKHLLIHYSDNGIGFAQKNSYGIGLTNTENRIHSVGGHIIFESEQGSGAKVIISIPL